MSKNLFNQLEGLGRERLSKSFRMREFLYSEIAYSEGIANIPDDPPLALAAGRGLCENVLEPIQDRLGRISIRSGFRSARVNQIGNLKKLNCASNERNRAGHIWDERDADGYMGATACIVLTSFLPYYERTGDWTALAWWIWENIPSCCSQYWFPNLAAVNLRWSENPQTERSIRTYAANPNTGDKAALVKAGVPTISGPYQQYYDDFLGTLERA